ncbi:MAG: hypothetical protein ACH346_05860 [Chthoniobacterales bacterium]
MKIPHSFFFLFPLVAALCSLLTCMRVYAQADTYTHTSAHEVTASEYANFLNQNAASDPDHLFDPKMETDPEASCIVRLGTPGTFHYEVIAGRENFSVCYVNEFDKENYSFEQNLPTTENQEPTTSPLKCNTKGFAVDNPATTMLTLTTRASTSISSSYLKDAAEIVGIIGLLACPELMMRMSCAESPSDALRAETANMETLKIKARRAERDNLIKKESSDAAIAEVARLTQNETDRLATFQAQCMEAEKLNKIESDKFANYEKIELARNEANRADKRTMETLASAAPAAYGLVANATLMAAKTDAEAISTRHRQEAERLLMFQSEKAAAARKNMQESIRAEEAIDEASQIAELAKEEADRAQKIADAAWDAISIANEEAKAKTANDAKNFEGHLPSATSKTAKMNSTALSSDIPPPPPPRNPDAKAACVTPKEAVKEAIVVNNTKSKDAKDQFIDQDDEHQAAKNIRDAIMFFENNSSRHENFSSADAAWATAFGAAKYAAALVQAKAPAKNTAIAAAIAAESEARSAEIAALTAYTMSASNEVIEAVRTKLPGAGAAWAERVRKADMELVSEYQIVFDLIERDRGQALWKSSSLNLFSISLKYYRDEAIADADRTVWARAWPEAAAEDGERIAAWANWARARRAESVRNNKMWLAKRLHPKTDTVSSFEYHQRAMDLQRNAYSAYRAADANSGVLRDYSYYSNSIEYAEAKAIKDDKREDNRIREAHPSCTIQ